MSVFSGGFNEGEQAAEKLADHVTDHIGTDAPTLFRRLLDVLTEYRLFIGIEKKP